MLESFHSVRIPFIHPPPDTHPRPYSPSAPWDPLTAAHLREHGQFFGKVDDTGDGRSDDLGELAEGLQVHLVSVRRGGDGGLADFVWLRGKTNVGG